MHSHCLFLSGLRGPGVAPQCCSVQHINGRLSLVPHQATGILLNGAPVTEPSPLSHGIFCKPLADSFSY